MATNDEAFRQRLLETFRGEAKDHVQILCSGLLELEQAPAENRMATLETVFREVHSLKGAARAVEMAEIEALCQDLESVFAALKRGTLELTGVLFDLLHQAADMLRKQLAPPDGTAQKAQVSKIKESLALVLKNRAPGEAASVLPNHSAFFKPAGGKERQVQGPEQTELPLPPKQIPQGDSPETVKIPTVRLNSILLQTEDFLSEKLAFEQRLTNLKEILKQFAAGQKEWGKIQPDLAFFRRSLDRQPALGQRLPEEQKLARLLEFLEGNKTFVTGLENTLKTLAKSSERESRSLGSRVNALSEQVKEMLLLPFSFLLEPFPKLVRDLSRAQGKEVELEISGGQIEIDRRILEGIKDPMIHLIRNAVDHGIEASELRIKKGKRPKGTLAMHIARQEGGKVEIVISDDGAGIDLNKVKEKALREGLLPTQNGADFAEGRILDCIFETGISTSSIITDLSGRGLGLAIVREKAEKLGGSVSVESRPGQGTRFRLLLPTSLARFQGVVVRACDHQLVIPAINVEQVLRVAKEEIKTVEGLDTIEIRGQAVSLVGLGEVLGLSSRSLVATRPDLIQVAVLGSSGTSIAFRVEEVLGDQEILVKNLGPQLLRVRNVAGAAFLKTGKAVPVLNVPDLLRSAVQRGSSPVRNTSRETAESRPQPTILVVEDSITSRMLLKNILEAAGYRVETAVDGMDGFTRARSDDFDLIVSDVDMPRMNGFDLTARIRADKKLADLPVVLVTSLESREDKERGIEVGANAYIVKGDFDQSNLLETVGRLI